MKFVYYSVNALRQMMPKWLFRLRLRRRLASLSGRKDREYIERRVDYYNKLKPGAALPPSAPTLGEHRITGQKVYYYDSYQYTRWFPDRFRWSFLPGDINFVPDCPSVVKSRPIGPDNANGVLLKLNKVRHFIFVNDPVPFERKKDMVIFRGKVKGKPLRRRFMEMYFGHPLCDLGDVSRNTTDPAEWRTEKKTIREHLEYKFVMALEGNDVASNLKWIMSSNSIAVMPKPTCETWFMEGTLIPDYHYIEIKPDFSDLEERLRYYMAHVDEALAIIRHANEYVEQFKNKEREDLISLLVLDKYFRMTGQERGR